jgi:hypothetical protein
MVEAKGRVVKGGQPLKLGPQGSLQVVFYPQAREERGEFSTYPATVNYSDGTFAVEEKIPAGTYHISVQQLDPYPFVDKLQGAFFGEQSPIVREVTGEPIEVDLDKPTG